jgi:hypothetical protein
MRLAVVAVLFFAVSASSASGQTARQGSTPAPPAERFRSPMIVETPLIPFDDVNERGAKGRLLADTTGLSRFVCAGISVVRLTANASEKLDGEQRRSLEIGLTLASAREEDKDVGVAVELVRDGRIVASSELPSVEVEEGSRATRKLKWQVASDEIDSMPAGLIRVTVTVPGGENLGAPAFVAAPPIAVPAAATDQTTDRASPVVPVDGAAADPQSAPPPPAGIDPSTCRTLISEADFDKAYFVTLKEVKVSKKFYGSVEEMYGPLAEKARKIGADAVINVHTWHAVSGFAWAAPHAGGMAVKWTEAGRKALHGFPGRCY